MIQPTNKERLRQLVLPAGLVMLDLFTKAMAIAKLPPGRSVDLDANLQLVLRVNYEELGSWAQALDSAAESAGDARVAGVVIYLGFALAFLGFPQTSLSRWQKAGVLGVILVASPFVGAAFHLFFPILAAPVVARLCAAAFFGVQWWLSKPGLWRTICALLMSAGLGNSLGLLVHSDGIVDFIYSRWMTELLRVGVFNIADLYFDVAIACGLVLVGQFAARSASRAATRLLRPA